MPGFLLTRTCFDLAYRLMTIVATVVAVELKEFCTAGIILSAALCFLAAGYRFSMFHTTGIGESGIPAKELRKARRAMYCPVGR